MIAYRAADLMAVAMARLLRDGEVVFQGVNSILPSAGAEAAGAAPDLHQHRRRLQPAASICDRLDD
jgi:acyl CoA:acetate/3-ketoacid CoA transferase beta subunit